MGLCWTQVGPGTSLWGLVGLGSATWQRCGPHPTHVPACWGDGCGMLAAKWLPRGTLELSFFLPTPKSTLGGSRLPAHVPAGLPTVQPLPSLPAPGAAPAEAGGMLVASLQVEASACEQHHILGSSGCWSDCPWLPRCRNVPEVCTFS